MDLGIKGKKAIVCASSKGLGKACATSLVQEGVDVIINSRNEIDLKEIQTELSFLEAGKVDYVVADLNTEQGRDNLISSCPEADILINNNGGPPPGNFLEMEKTNGLKPLNQTFYQQLCSSNHYYLECKKGNLAESSILLLQWLNHPTL